MEMEAAVALKKLEEYFDWCARQSRLSSELPRRSTEPPAAKRRKTAAKGDAAAESTRAGEADLPSPSAADSQELLAFSTKEFIKSEAMKEFKKLAKNRYVLDMLKVDAAPKLELIHAVNGFAKMLKKLMTLQPAVKKEVVTKVVLKVTAIFNEVGRKMSVAQRFQCCTNFLAVDLKGCGLELPCKKEPASVGELVP